MIKKIFVPVLAISLLMLCGCAKVDKITIDKSKVSTRYTAQYKIATDSLSYNNTYTVTYSDSGELVVFSEVKEPWSKQEGENLIESTQIMTTTSCLNGTDNFGVPIKVEGEFKIENQPTYSTSFIFEHNHEMKAGVLKTKKYSSNAETGVEEEVYSLKLEDQYFDKDTLPFIISGFVEDEGTIKVSSGNRDSLQPVRFEKMGTEEVTVTAGTFTCTVIRLRPDSNFSVNSATVYIDAKNGIPVKIIHDSSIMELTNYQPYN